MALAVESTCNEYIVAAGISCINFITDGRLTGRALDVHRVGLEGIATSYSPMICNVVNGFITNVTGMWTDTIVAAQTIINAVKRALSNPKKIKKAFKKMIALAKQLLDRVKLIIEFIQNAPTLVEDFLLKTYNDAIADFEAYIAQLEADARAKCELRKASLIEKLELRYINEQNPDKRAQIEQKMANIQAKSCANLISTGFTTIAWPQIPQLVFGLGALMQSILPQIRIPTLISFSPFLENSGPTFMQEGIKSKVESIMNWTNSKIDSVQKTLGPWVAAFNTIMELLKALSSLSLKKTLKWLIQLPKKIIKTWLDTAKFGIDLFKSLAEQNPLIALRVWAEDQFDGLISSLEAKAAALDSRYQNFKDTFWSELFNLFGALLGGVDAMRAYFMAAAQRVGPMFGSIIDFIAQMYGVIMGGFSYLMQVIVSPAAPLLGLIGLGASMFSTPPVSNPATGGTNPSALDVEEEYDVLYYQDVSGVMTQCQYDIELGAPIPYDVSGVALSIDPSTGTYPSPEPSRPFMQYGYFSTTLTDTDGDPLRVNAVDVPNTIEPLTDPEVLRRASRPDITLWKYFTFEEPLSSGVITEPINGSDMNVGTYTRQITSRLEFIGVPYYGYVERDADTSLDMSQYTSNGQSLGDVTGDLTSEPDPNELVKRYQGKFRFVRHYRFIETITRPNYRNPINVSRTLESSDGYYNYAAFDDGLQFMVEWQHLNFTKGGPRDPDEADLVAVFYAGNGMDSNDIEQGRYDNLGKLYLENNLYRFGLFSNYATPALFKPEQDGYPWPTDVRGNPRYKLLPNSTDDIDSIIAGGVTMQRHPIMGLIPPARYMGAYLYNYIGQSDILGTETTLSDVTFHYKQEDFDGYSGIAFDYDENNFVAPITSGQYEYYISFRINNAISGFMGDADLPFDLT